MSWQTESRARRAAFAALDPSLDARVRAWALRRQCSEQEIAEVLEQARRDPEYWRQVVEADEPPPVTPGVEYVLSVLRKDPSLKRAFYTDGKVRYGMVVVTVGVRYEHGIATCDLAIPAEKFNPIAVLEVIRSTN